VRVSTTKVHATHWAEHRIGDHMDEEFGNIIGSYQEKKRNHDEWLSIIAAKVAWDPILFRIGLLVDPAKPVA